MEIWKNGCHQSYSCFVSKILIFLASVVVITLLPFCTANAGSKTYENGKLISVQSPEITLHLSSIDLPMQLSYEFEIQQGDLVYVGSCRRQDYKPEWQAGRDVQFRLNKDSVYLRRPNGKELRLVFLLHAKLGPDGKPITILRSKKK
jgi:hypothetical protein